MRKIIIYIIWLMSIGGYSQNAEYFVNNYLPKTYDASNTNYDLAQDEYGNIFIANLNGILKYDGINWETIKINANEEAVFAIKYIDKLLYYGTETGNFGIIKRNNKGQYICESFISNLKTAKFNSSPIKQIISLNNRIYFLSPDLLIEYYNGTFKTYKPTNQFHIRSLVIGKHLFLIDIDNGFFVLENGVLNPVKNTEQFAQNKAYFSLPLSNNLFAIGFRNIGIYFANYNVTNPSLTKFTKANSKIDDVLIDAEIINSAPINIKEIIVTSNKKGAFVINNKLEIVNRFNTKNGIRDDNVKAAFQDKNGNVWLALNYGVSYIEYNSPLKKLTQKNGINGLLENSINYNNDIYIATDKGVLKFNNQTTQFENIPDAIQQSFYLLKYDNKLLIATSKGIYVYDNKQYTQIVDNDKTYYFLLNDPYQPNLIYGGTDDGVDVFHYSNNILSFIKSYIINDEVRSIACDYNRNIYFGTSKSNVYFLNYKNSYLIDSITPKDGLPSKAENYVFTYNNRLLIGTDSSIYSVSNLKGKKFICKKDPLFYTVLKGKQIFRAVELDGDLICNASSLDKSKTIKEILYVKKNSNKVDIIPSSLSHLKNIKVNSITNDSINNSLYISTDDGLFILKKENNINTKQYNLSIYKIFDNNNDTISSNINLNNIKELVIPFSHNNIKIIPGYNCFENIDNSEFSWYLQGQDETYSDWKKDKQIIYNNLHEGNYIFFLKARNEFSNQQSELKFIFKILPPWYRTIWAYAMYVIAFLIFIYVVVRFNTKRLKEQNIKLENVISERTKEITKQKEELAHKHKEITDSINYAERIQRSFMATKELLNNNLSEYFVFFKPKDVVSGDFYWGANLVNSNGDDNFILATADSTGHGVPGAIMSLLNITSLEKAIEYYSNPHDILNNTRQTIINRLKKDGTPEGGKDGMDCSLCLYDFKNMKLHVAAANNPIWLIRNAIPLVNEKSVIELVEVKPDKMPVGKHDKQDIPFTLQVFDLQKGDVIYTLTDGFPDQFGGQKGKKFMSKNLRELLVANAHLPMYEQQQLLENTFNNWIGALEQVDDVTIIGVRIS